RWTTRTLGKVLGVSHTTIGKVWRSSGVRPPRYRRWRLSADPRFLDRRVDVAGIYVNPPGTLIALTVGPRTGPSASTGPSLRTASKGGSPPEEFVSHPVGTGERLAETMGVLDVVPPSASSWRLTSRELLLFLESIDNRTGPTSEIHLLTGASSFSRDDRVVRWIDRHPRFHLVTPEEDRPISAVIREWFVPRNVSPPDAGGLPNLPVLERLLGSFLEGVTLFGRPFAWTRNGAVSHWRNAAIETFPIAGLDSTRSSSRSRSR
ncbi:MAG: hypothetical protein WA688_05800, partial [Thermoplasmata archaeon]